MSDGVDFNEKRWVLSSYQSESFVLARIDTPKNPANEGWLEIRHREAPSLFSLPMRMAEARRLRDLLTQALEAKP